VGRSIQKDAKAGHKKTKKNKKKKEPPTPTRNDRTWGQPFSSWNTGKTVRKPNTSGKGVNFFIQGEVSIKRPCWSAQSNAGTFCQHPGGGGRGWRSTKDHKEEEGGHEKTQDRMVKKEIKKKLNSPCKRVLKGGGGNKQREGEG